MSPLEVQEALRRKVLKGMVWLSAVLMVLLLIASGTMLYLQHLGLRREADRAEAALAEREAQSSEDGKVVQSRMPLLRAHVADTRQREATQAIARLAEVLLRAPQGVELERVEIQQSSPGTIAHRFSVSGLAYTDKTFSVGPLATFVAAIAEVRGVQLEPIQEVLISDRVDESLGRIDQRAITRFTITGRVP